jgi:hypothetical protein
MSGWLRYFELTAKSKTGLSSGLGIWAVIALLAAVAAWLFLNVTVFVWLAQHYGTLTSAASMTAFHVLVIIVALVAIAIIRRRTITQARLALAERQSSAWLDPRLLTVGMEIGRSLGWRKLLSLGLVGIIAAGVTREWLHERQADDAPQPDEE